MGGHRPVVPTAEPCVSAACLSEPASAFRDTLGVVEVGAAVGGLLIRRLHVLGGGREGSDALAAETGKQAAAAVGGGVSLGHRAHYAV